MDANQGIYMDTEAVQNIANGFRSCSDVLGTVSQGLEIAITALQLTAFTNIIGNMALALEAYAWPVILIILGLFFLLYWAYSSSSGEVGGARGMPAEGPALARRWANEGEGRRKPFLVLESPTPDAPRGSRNRGVESWHEEGSRHADARASHRRHPQCRRRA